ncbi:hypothetical protein GHO42_04540 [Pseudomonas sp. FSL R10-0056]|uniref:hypothetical protein n=1 Tax=unclassified Pseudomonas TaxID=196821 RepID=UPI0012965C40|nr:MULTISPECIES: hypothetical protein [unclassified Pseudomonas]MDN5390456.1 hypothetical protein [Pseudomonas sp.]MDN5458902.1 hypothetical protein [Pseudomonas sp.]MQT62380.1 hypothetical protein [Pseudomonas sp. FSL R10-0056]MQT68171.1 hypothetical protein [Pseudomonas sp. FSL R10-0071]MQU47492.1 hypothetical protein [Pseudomonas sp. FSL A6-1183]
MSSPIIPWMGGKRRLADRLIPLFPPHECYVESSPVAGRFTSCAHNLFRLKYLTTSTATW